MNQQYWQYSLDGYLSALGRLCSPRCKFGVLSFPKSNNLDSAIDLYFQEMHRRYDEINKITGTEKSFNVLSSENISYKEVLEVFDTFIFQNLMISDPRSIGLLQHDIEDALMFAAENESSDSFDTLTKSTFRKLVLIDDKSEKNICIVIPLTLNALFIGLHLNA